MTTQKPKKSLAAHFLQEQLDNVLKDLAAQPNNLLLRCVKLRSGTSGPGDVFTNAERIYLASKMIANRKEVTDTFFDGTPKTPYHVIEGFLPPWDDVFTKLAKEMKAYKPTVSLQELALKS